MTASVLLGALGCSTELGAPNSDKAHVGPADPDQAGNSGGGDGVNGDGDSPGSGGASGGEAPHEFAPPASSLRRLSVSEYGNSVSDILGFACPDLSGLGSDDSVGGFISVGARRVALSATSVETFEQLSYDISQAAFSDELTRAGLVGCTPLEWTDSCAQGFLREKARRFFRRPPSDAEMQRLTDVVRTVSSASDIWTGLSYGLATMLQSPNFLYRVELGRLQDGTTWLSYDGFERATRLAYLLTGSTPDEQLMDAAEAGLLNTPEGYDAEVGRLMLSENLQNTLSTFFGENLRLQEIRSMGKDPALLDPNLRESMWNEVELLIRDFIWEKNLPFGEIFLSREAFVDSNLAQFYGMPAPSQEGFSVQVREVDDPRIGLLGTAGLLALNAGYSETSPTKRGRYIMEHILCQEIAEPPPGVDVTLEPVPEGVTLTMRERVELHLSNPGCATCHQAMDPLGLPLEHFDAVGQFRETDHGLPIDASGSLADVSFDGLSGLAAALAEDPRVPNCLVQKFYSFALGHQLGHSDERAISDLVASYNAAGGDFSELVRSLVRHDAFLFALESAR